MEEAGVKIRGTKFTNHLVDNPAKLQMSLQRKLRFSEASTRKFLSGFEELVENEAQLRKMLARCKPLKRPLSDKWYPSLVRIMLGVEILQNGVVSYLLQRLPEYDEPDIGIGKDVSTPTLILAQLRWMDAVFDGKFVTEKLLEILQMCPPYLQKWLIQAIPEIVDDAFHADIVSEFRQLMDDNTDLTVEILQALANLNVADSDDTIAKAVLHGLGNVNVEDLPVMIRYLLQTATKQSAPVVVKQLRRNLNFIGLTVKRKVPSKAVSKPDNRDVPVLVLDSLKNGFQFHKFVCMAFLKEIQSLKLPGEHKSLDVWILLTVQSMAQYSTRAFNVLKKKVARRQIDLGLIDRSVSQAGLVLESLFRPIIQVAEQFVRDSHPAVQRAGATMYSQAFLKTRNRFQRQEIISNMINHIGSGNATEVDACLDHLLLIANTDAASLVPFAAFMKGLFDYLDAFQDEHVRKLFTMFGKVSAFETRQTTNSQLGTEIHILIRKQVTSHQAKYKRVGVIAGIAMLCSSRIPDEQPVPEDALKEVNDVLQLFSDMCERQPEHLRMLHHELASVVKQGLIHPQIITTVVQDRLTSSFESHLADLDGTMPDEKVGEKLPKDLTMGLWMGLDGDNGQICVNFLPIFDEAAAFTVVNQSSQFRLFTMCEAIENEGSLSQIDALLGCPLLLFNEEHLDEFVGFPDETKTAMCHAVVCAIAWLRELINAFASQRDQEMLAKACQRVKHLMRLEQVLHTLVSQFTSYRPIGYESRSQAAPKRKSVGGDVKKSEGGRRKVKKQKKGHKLDDAEAMDSQSTKDSKKNSKKSSSRDVALEIIEQIDNDLTLEALYLLNLDCCQPLPDWTPPLTQTQGDVSQPNASPFLPARIELDAVQYLIKFLLTQSKASLKTTAPWIVAGPPKNSLSPAQLIQRLLAARVFPALGKHTATCFQWIQANLRQGDDGVENEIKNQYSSESLAAVVGDILSILRLVVKCDLLNNSDHHKLLSRAFVGFTNGVRRKLGLKLISKPNTEDVDIARACESLFSVLHLVMPCLGELDIASRNLAVLELLANYMSPLDKGMATKLSATAEQILKTDWVEHKARADTVGVAVRVYVRYANDPVATIAHLANNALPTVFHDEGDDLDHSFSTTLHRRCVQYYYAPMLEELLKAFEQQKTEGADVAAALQTHCAFADTLLAVVQLCKQLSGNSAVMVCTVKQAKPFIELAAKRLSFFQKSFTTHYEHIVAYVKSLQRSTRILQMICAHLKTSARSASTATHVPQLKKALESFIYQVKVMLQENKSLDGVFWQGNLKHRAMDGSEIIVEHSGDDGSEDEGSGDEGVVEADD